MRKPPSHDLQAPQQLPVTLAPCTDELLSSWVARHAKFYGIPTLAMLRHCIPEGPSLCRSGNDTQHHLRERGAVVSLPDREGGYTVSLTCYPAAMKPRVIVRTQLLGWRIICAFCSGRPCWSEQPWWICLGKVERHFQIKRPVSQTVRGLGSQAPSAAGRDCRSHRCNGQWQFRLGSGSDRRSSKSALISTS